MAKPGDKKVLVVDDEEDVVFFLSTALEDAGFRVETASSVDEALRSIKAAPPDFVSLDMVLPGKSGIVLFHELRRNPAWSKIPVSMVGPATYLEKPVTGARYVRAVADLLGVEIEGGGEEADAGDLRRQAEALLRSADSETLKEALRLLKKS
ncbi:MAG: response regulator [Acidobacteriota bacterium]